MGIVRIVWPEFPQSWKFWSIIFSNKNTINCILLDEFLIFTQFCPFSTTFLTFSLKNSTISKKGTLVTLSTKRWAKVCAINTPSLKHSHPDNQVRVSWRILLDNIFDVIWLHGIFEFMTSSEHEKLKTLHGLDRNPKYDTKNYIPSGLRFWSYTLK